MPLVYLIPGARKAIHTGPTVQDTIPTPGIDHAHIRAQHYANALEAHRYITKARPQIHQGPIQVDLYIPKLPTVYKSGVNYKVRSGSVYIDVPVVASFQDTFSPRKFAYPYPSYGIKTGSKFIDGPFVITTPDGYILRKQPYQPLPYTVLPRPTKIVDIPAFVAQQTYEFKVQKPIQEWYQRQFFNQHVIKPKPWTESLSPVLSGNALLACIDTAISWQDHFLTHGWTNIQDQITAGYTIYIQPSKTVGSYQEVFDFGSIIQNIITVVNWNQVQIAPTVTTSSTTLETSTDGITWTAPVVGTSVFAQSLRYVRLTMNFVGTNDHSLAVYKNLQCLLNVHREQDGGQANVFAADAGGTTIFFNKQFKALDALALTPLSTVEQKAVYDFAFPVNPVSFKALLYNAAGARIDGLITWVARGIF